MGNNSSSNNQSLQVTAQGWKLSTPTGNYSATWNAISNIAIGNQMTVQTLQGKKLKLTKIGNPSSYVIDCSNINKLIFLIDGKAKTQADFETLFR